MSDKRCPRCDGGRMLFWDELNNEEHEVVKRLPGSADYSLEVRMARHRWCRRCWYEETSGSPTLT